MARRDLLTDAERQMLFGVPFAREDLARHYMLGPRDLALVAARRGCCATISLSASASIRMSGDGVCSGDGRA
jgi:hypothetical protein